MGPGHVLKRITMSVDCFALRRTLIVIITVLATWFLGVPAQKKVAASEPDVIAPERTVNAPDAEAGGFFGQPLPGTPSLDAQLVDRLKSAWEARDSAYKPRTRHLNPDGSPQYTNRLFLESSPYLLQHAHNPLNWYPWGDEAFDTARKFGRPVLLSVGYSTCHWCHVMEEESFDDEEIARYLNEHYIAIKVDREERPDIDAIYMTAVQAMTGHGGWPMTVWLTPDRKPFYSGTYFPARDGDRDVEVGFFSLLKRVHAVYVEAPERVGEAAAEIVQIVQTNLAPKSTGASLPNAQVLQAVADIYRQRFDSTYGGLQGAPKFPSSLPIRLLLRHYRRTNDQQLLAIATLTLEKMAAGGMYDHMGGGFHRYSTDAQWLVPHFEKMLYDNALLTMAYLEGYQVTGREDFAQVAREILHYVERDMTAPAGAFYSASDADSVTPSGHREEGWFFTWTPAEIETVLSKEQARLVTAYYGVTAAGNFEGRNILYTRQSLAKTAENLTLQPEHVRAVIEEAKELLYKARAKRPAPLRDEKILTAWNGLMISAHAQAALILRNSRYTDRAVLAADFVLTKMRKGGRLLRSYTDGQARHNGYLDDYAFLIAGLLDLYEATGTMRWLQEAVALDKVLENHYEDKQAGGFFMTSDDHEVLLAREKPSYDGAEPSGNSVQALNLLRLYEFTTEDRYRVRAEKTLQAFGEILKRAPVAVSELLLAVDYHLDTPKEIVIVTPQSRADAAPFLARLGMTFLPNRILTVVTEGEDLAAHATLVPLVENKVAQGGKTTAYVCERKVCALPTTDPVIFAKQISFVHVRQVAQDP
jgi:hypothetical protein